MYYYNLIVVDKLIFLLKHSRTLCQIEIICFMKQEKILKFVHKFTWNFYSNNTSAIFFLQQQKLNTDCNTYNKPK